jgi:hypothetical protein
MEKNSIINSLKRLERVGSETSRVTQKLKKSVEDVAKKILDSMEAFRVNDHDFYLSKISDKLFYTSYQAILILYWDIDGKLYDGNAFDYALMPDNCYVSLDIALDFSKAIANGLLKKIADFIEKEKAIITNAIEVIEKK